MLIYFSIFNQNHMKKMRFLLAITGLVSVLAFAGCQAGQPAGEPDDVVNGSLTKLTDVTSYSVETSVDGALTTNGDTLNFKANLDTDQDFSDLEDLKFRVAFDGDASSDSKENPVSGNVKLEVKVLDKTVYFSIDPSTKLTDIVPDEMLEKLAGQWWSYPLPEEAVKEFASEMPSISGNDEDLTPEQKEVKELVKTAKFFKNSKYLGSDKYGYHYSVEFDADGIIAFAKKASEVNGTTFDEDAVKSIKDAVAMVDKGLEIWVAKDTMAFSGIKGSVNVDSDGVTGLVNLDFHLMNLNKSIKVTSPKDAKEFDPSMLYGDPTSDIPMEDPTDM